MSFVVFFRFSRPARTQVTGGDTFPKDSVNRVNFVRKSVFSLNEAVGHG